MANEKKKEEIREARLATDSNIRELQQTVAALPRTDHMTLPAIQVAEIDEQTRARAAAIVAINNARNADDVVDEETGKTLGQVKSEFEYGVSDMNEEAGKHEIQINETENGLETVTIIPPVREVTNEQGEVVEVKDEEVVIEPTPANIAPVDVNAPHNPVEAREAAGLNPDGSEGDTQVVPGSGQTGAPSAREAAPQGQPVNMGTREKVGGGQDSGGANAGGNVPEEK